MQVLNHIKWHLLDLKRVRWESPEALAPGYRSETPHHQDRPRRI